LSSLKDEIIIRCERRSDEEDVARTFREAFGRTWESELVVQLRATGELVFLLVAQYRGRVIGAAVFNRVVISGPRGQHAAVGLGPVGVAPGLQRRGVGTRLIEVGLELLKDLGHTRIVVVGDPRYYGKLGFRSADKYRITCDQAQAQSDVLLAELSPHSFGGIEGIAHYPPAFMA